MSWKALAWASEQKCGAAPDKLILLALAERHNSESKVAYPSAAWLTEFSSLNRKTVLKSLERLQAAGLIIDSGRRMGSTGGVKAWHLAFDQGEAVPKTAPLKRSQIYAEAVPLFPEAVPNSGQLSGPKNGIRNLTLGTCEEPGFNHSPPTPQNEITESVAIWHEAAARQGWSKIQTLTPARRDKLKARLSENGLDGWRDAIAKAEQSQALTTDPPPSWFGFDFLVKNPENMLKVIEGKYARKFGKAAEPSGWRWINGR